MIRTPDASGPAAPVANPQAARAAAADLLILAFPLLLLDAVRRVHAPGHDEFQLVLEDPAFLAPGLAADGCDRFAILASAWIDLSGEPVILHLPPTHGRHFVLTICDAMGGIFASVGSRRGEYPDTNLALVGPRWCGQLPSGLQARRAPSDGVWALSRTYAHSAIDRPAALARTRRLVARRYGSGELLHPAVTALQASARSCLSETLDMAAPELFERLDERLDRIDPRSQGQFRQRLYDLRAQIGVPPQGAIWSPELIQALDRGFADAKAAIHRAATQEMQRTPGWRLLPVGTTEAGLAPLARAARLYTSLGAPAREDLLTFVCDQDDRGRPLSGTHRYRLHFARDALPPADAFWRLSVCGTSEGDWPRSLGDRSDLAPNADGSLDVLVQHTPPALEQTSNWLPAPTDEWSLVLRLHCPRADILSQAWLPPTVERVDGGSGRNQGGRWRWRPNFTAQPRLRNPSRPPPEELNP